MKLERRQGPPHEIVLSFKVSLFISFIQSWKKESVFIQFV